MANKIEVRFLGAISYFHAAEAGYLESCRKYFMLFGIKMVDTSFVSKNNSDLAIDKLIEDIASGQ